jgi:hypothetical protein
VLLLVRRDAIAETVRRACAGLPAGCTPLWLRNITKRWHLSVRYNEKNTVICNNTAFLVALYSSRCRKCPTEPQTRDWLLGVQTQDTTQSTIEHFRHHFLQCVEHWMYPLFSCDHYHGPSTWRPSGTAGTWNPRTFGRLPVAELLIRLAHA